MFAELPLEIYFYLLGRFLRADYIHHDEVIFPRVNPKRVREIWKLPVKKVVIAKWLEIIANDLGIDCYRIPLGVDEVELHMKRSINDRDKIAIMLYHIVPDKGSWIGIRVAQRLKEEMSDFQLIIFNPLC